MDFEPYVHHVVAFVREHAAWAPPIIFALAFGESLAFVSLLFPAWTALIAMGALVRSGGLDFWPVWVAGGPRAPPGGRGWYWGGRKRPPDG
ncbi:MAG: DedA family protein, partial [Pseudolabrys sp.]|nr:DedA family protein [Pseudolabrys sp.]